MVSGLAWLADWERVNFGDAGKLLAAAKCVRAFPWRHVLWFLVSHLDPLEFPAYLEKFF